MKEIQIKDKRFRTFIPEADILREVHRVASEISRDLEGENPLFVSVLNGSFMFTADLMKCLDIPCEVSFVKLASYAGTSSTGKVKELVGLNEDIHLGELSMGQKKKAYMCFALAANNSEEHFENMQKLMTMLEQDGIVEAMLEAIEVENPRCWLLLKDIGKVLRDLHEMSESGGERSQADSVDDFYRLLKGPSTINIQHNTYYGKRENKHSDSGD